MPSPHLENDNENLTMETTQLLNAPELLTAYPIIIDTREQRPLEFPPSVKTERAKLDTGDYSISGWTSAFAVERKSITDLVGSLTNDRERFERELKRMTAFEFRRVIVEGSYRQAVEYIWRNRRSHPAAVIGSINAFEVRYGVPFIFAASRNEASGRVANWARYFVREKLKRQAEILNPPPSPHDAD